MRVFAIALALAVVVFVVSGGHVFFLPFLFVPVGSVLVRAQAAAVALVLEPCGCALAG